MRGTSRIERSSGGGEVKRVIPIFSSTSYFSVSAIVAAVISPTSVDCDVIVLYKAVEEPIRVQCSSIDRRLAAVVRLMVC